jgi:hypothetical protein
LLQVVDVVAEELDEVEQLGSNLWVVPQERRRSR